MMQEKREKVSELIFGLAMLVWEAKGLYPLEIVTAVKGEDEGATFYFPVINIYQESSKQYFTGPVEGYSNREELLRCVGRCWDTAEESVRRNMDSGMSRVQAIFYGNHGN